MAQVQISREEFLKRRQQGIGGSDAAVACGLSRWKSPVRLYLEKVGEADVLSNDNMNEQMYWGTVLEDVVAKEFSKRTDKKVHKVNQLLQSKEYPFMIANIDRKIEGENALLECKTTTQYNVDEWQGDQIPIEYLLQVMHYLAVTNYEKGYIAALIGGNKFVYKEIKRDEDLIKMLIEKEKYFWDCVVNRRMPAIDGTEDSKKMLDYLFPTGVGSIEMPELESISDEIYTLKQQQKQLEAMIMEKENQIKMQLTTTERALAGKYVITWQNVVTHRFDTTALKENDINTYNKYLKETNTRRLTINERKGNHDNFNA